jgi:hypothetical protein
MNKQELNDLPLSVLPFHRQHSITIIFPSAGSGERSFRDIIHSANSFVPKGIDRNHSLQV